MAENDSFGRERSTAKVPQIKETKTVMMYGKEVQVKVFSAGRMPEDREAKRKRDLEAISNVFKE